MFEGELSLLSGSFYKFCIFPKCESEFGNRCFSLDGYEKVKKWVLTKGVRQKSTIFATEKKKEAKNRTEVPPICSSNRVIE